MSARKGKIKTLYANQGGLCFWCKRQMVLTNKSARRGLDATIDHLVPRSQGGTNKDGVVAACADCNTKRGDLSVEEFRARKTKYQGRKYTEAEREEEYQRLLACVTKKEWPKPHHSQAEGVQS